MRKIFFTLLFAFSLSSLADIVKYGSTYYTVDPTSGKTFAVDLIYHNMIEVQSSNIVKYGSTYYTVDPTSGKTFAVDLNYHNMIEVKKD